MPDASMHFASFTRKYAKLNEVEPTNIPYAATKAKLSLSILRMILRSMPKLS
jgi:hypothetical protein